jgi:cysteine synthase
VEQSRQRQGALRVDRTGDLGADRRQDRRFICSVGTGGTLAGTSRYLKEKHPGIVNACADPHGFAMYELFKHGTAKSTPGDSITEGIG